MDGALPNRGVSAARCAIFRTRRALGQRWESTRTASCPRLSHERPARFVLIMPPSPWRRLHAQFDDGAPPSLRAAQNQIEAVFAPAPPVVWHVPPSPAPPPDLPPPPSPS